jgi:hypothetical protein
MTDEGHAVIDIADRIKPLLAGLPPPIQGAVLAELLSIYLAGHVHIGVDGHADFAATAQMREQLLAEHIKVVRDLIGINEAIMTNAPRRQ